MLRIPFNSLLLLFYRLCSIAAYKFLRFCALVLTQSGYFCLAFACQFYFLWRLISRICNSLNCERVFKILCVITVLIDITTQRSFNIYGVCEQKRLVSTDQNVTFRQTVYLNVTRRNKVYQGITGLSQTSWV